jgi:hypothetical protein
MNEQRPLYDVVISPLVIDEAAMGDANAAARRRRMLDGIADMHADGVPRRK